MTEFLATYGLWLLIALLVVIVIAFLLSGKKKDGIAPVAESETPPPPVIAAPPAPVADPIPVVLAPMVAAAIPETPMPEPVPAIAPASGTADDLLLLKGVGPKLATLLAELGVTRFAQIAAWSDSDLTAIDARLGTFKGRPTRDQWIDQAKYLAAGDTAGFEAKYGKL